MTSEELARLGDHYKEIKTKRLLADKVAEELKTQENAAKAQIINEMLEQKITGIGGYTIKLGLVASEEPVAKNWEEIWAYMTENQDFSLVQKRLSPAAIKERWANGEVVPGTDRFTVYKLSESKV